MPEKLWRERLDALRELAQSTDDMRAKKQITERVKASMYALECSREYAAVCRSQDRDAKLLENAENAEDILW